MTKPLTHEEQVELVVTLKGFRKQFLDNAMKGIIKLQPHEFKHLMARIDAEIDFARRGL